MPSEEIVAALVSMAGFSEGAAGAHRTDPHIIFLFGHFPKTLIADPSLRFIPLFPQVNVSFRSPPFHSAGQRFIPKSQAAAFLSSIMACGFCEETGHNKKTCKRFHAAEIARMVSERGVHSHALHVSEPALANTSSLPCRSHRARPPRTTQLAQGAATDAVFAACGPFGAAASCMMKAYTAASAATNWSKMSINERERAILAIAVDAM